MFDNDSAEKERCVLALKARLNGTNYQIMIVAVFYPVLASIKPILGHRFQAVWPNGRTKTPALERKLILDPGKGEHP